MMKKLRFVAVLMGVWCVDLVEAADQAVPGEASPAEAQPAAPAPAVEPAEPVVPAVPVDGAVPPAESPAPAENVPAAVVGAGDEAVVEEEVEAEIEEVPEPPSVHELINGLSETQVEQAIQNIRLNFLDDTKTDDRELRRSTLEGLIGRLAPGATLAMEIDANRAATAGGFLAEILDKRVGYVRVGPLDSEGLAQMDAAIERFNEQAIRSLVLDLRASPASRDFDVAAEFARRFAQKGKLLFSIEKPTAKQERILTSNQDPTFNGVVVVLTDATTAGAPEVLAATLRLNARAMIVGAQTMGEAVEFLEVPLGDLKMLRVAVAQVTLPESGPIYPNGVSPDIVASLDPEVQEEIFRLSKDAGVSQFVFEIERPHMNEAALVANTNPELDPKIYEQANEAGIWDTVLQRAVDLVTAISFYSERSSDSQ